MPHLHKYKSTTQKGNCEACGQPREKHCCSDYYRQRTIEYVGYEKWLPNVRMAVAEEIPDDMLFDYIRRGCIQFACDSGILRRNITLQLQDCVTDYYPCVGNQERIDRVRLLSIGGQCYEPVGDTCTWQLCGYRFWFHPPHTLEVHPAPKEADCREVILTVISAPDEASTQVDKLIHDRYFEAIENYAIAKALLIPLAQSKHRQSDGAAIMRYRMAEFKSAVTRAKIDIARHYAI